MMSLNLQIISFATLVLTNCVMLLLLVSNAYEKAVSVPGSFGTSLVDVPHSSVSKRISKAQPSVKHDLKAQSRSDKKDIYVTSNVIQCEENRNPNGKVSQWSLLFWDSVQDGRQYGCRATEILNWALYLRENEMQVYSKHGEDGVLMKVFERIGVTNSFFAEFYVGDGRRCNTRVFRENHTWTGVTFDNSHSNSTILLHKETITIDNVVELFRQYNVPKQFDLLSVNADFSDFWLMREILMADYEPRVVVVEINVAPGPFASFAIPYDAANSYENKNKTRWFGASVLAFSKLMHTFDYQLLYVEKRIQSAIFIKNSELGNVDLARLAWQRQQFEGLDHYQSQPPDDQNRPFVHVCQRLPCDSSNDW